MGAEQDYFTDPAVLIQPYAYFEAVRALGPVHYDAARDVYIVTGFEETLAILRDADTFSSSIAISAAQPLPFTSEGDDVSTQLAEHYATIAGPDLIVTQDGARHSASRALLNRLFVPSRLKANQAFIGDYADHLASDVVTRGQCELIHDVAVPFVTLVIADLLGVPADDREKFRALLDNGPTAGDINKQGEGQDFSTLMAMGGFFMGYLSDRRSNPRGDVLSELAQATYPDGSTPDILDLVKASTFLFAAGQDTSAKLLGNALKHLCEDQVLQSQLRADRSLVPAFVEEMLRLEGSTKATFRIARRTAEVGGVNIPAGKKIVVSLSAANRDPRRWQDPTAFRLDRPKALEHLAFGRGAHVCVGAPLARTEVRVMLDRLLALTSSISLSQEHHGPKDAQHFDYEPSFIIRGLNRLHLKLTPA
jgi:cytochrome P450